VEVGGAVLDPAQLSVDQVVDLGDVRGWPAGERLPVDPVRQPGETVECRGHPELRGAGRRPGRVGGRGRSLRARGSGENKCEPREANGQAPTQPTALAACCVTIHRLSPSIVLVASGTVPAAAHWPA